MMVRLPAYNKFRCANCHTSSTPIAGNTGLNVFGADFKQGGNVWSEALAVLNSDGDRCTNGFELGDEDGDGLFDDPGEVLERSNPANSSDCSIAVTKATWSVIKDIFGKEIQQYLPEEPAPETWDGWTDEFYRHFP